MPTTAIERLVDSGVHPTIARLRGGLIVSCQALPGEPLYNEAGGIMPLMARAAMEGGAVAIRANGQRDVAEIRATVDLPLIGLVKRAYPPYEPYITVTAVEVDELVAVGADIIATDCTNRLRPDGLAAAEHLLRIQRAFPGQLLMADVSTYEEGMAAAEAGAHLVSTTLDGYTGYTRGSSDKPDYELVARLAEDCRVPVVAEGSILYPWQAKEMLKAGAWSVAVGGAITRPREITSRFAEAMHGQAEDRFAASASSIEEDME